MQADAEKTRHAVVTLSTVAIAELSTNVALHAKAHKAQVCIVMFPLHHYGQHTSLFTVDDLATGLCTVDQQCHSPLILLHFSRCYQLSTRQVYNQTSRESFALHNTHTHTRTDTHARTHTHAHTNGMLVLFALV